MKNLKKLLAMLLVVVMLISALPIVSMAEVTDKLTYYAIAEAHLDTVWNWSFETTVREYLPKTFNNNFALFEQYPDYVFNFEGAYRYSLIKEYYPEAYEKIAEYVEKGNWSPSGSAWENGDVNSPSPEALIRNVLIGNQFFAEDFGNEARSRDIMLPDCFGFGYAMPAWISHCNLIAFHTQKLSWGNTWPGEVLPFNVGSWTGVDGNKVMASIDNGNYTWNMSSQVSNGNFANWSWGTSRANNNKNYGWYATVFYHGTGDTGGSPATASVRTVDNAFQNNASNSVNVIHSTSDQWAVEMTDAQKASLPNYNGEMLLREHGTGTYTARAMGHRWNSRNELLAAAAESSATAASWLGTENYPTDKFNEAWKRVIAHQFHDDITGTSLNTVYLRSWNEYMVSLNQFGNEYENAVSGVASLMNTSAAQGVALVVNNPLEFDRDDTVVANVDMGEAVNAVRVYDAKGNEVPSQILSKDGNVVEVLFKASVPSLGYSVYDVRKADTACNMKSALSATKKTLSNEKYNVTIDDNGDISSIYDKEIGKELLASPIRLGMLSDTETEWPSWELKFNDYAFKAPREYVEDKASEITIEENGPARVALRVKRSYANSTYDQLISLEAGGKAVEVENVFNWYEAKTMLKAVFNTTASNSIATYDLGLGAIERPNNTQYQAEAPAQKWADITDASGDFGVSILSDSKNGWDKPADDTLRLTLIHTPSGSYGSDHGQNYLEHGENRFGFAIYGHANTYNESETQIQAQLFTEPMTAFQTSAHTGALGSEYSFGSISNTDVIVRAIKKGETGVGLDNTGDEYIVRFNEGAKREANDVEFTLGNGIVEARPIWGSEESMTAEEIAAANEYKVVDGKLVFDMDPYEIRSFAIKLADPAVNGEKDASASVALPYNVDAISSNANKADSTLDSKKSAFPAELIPETITTAGVDFAINKSADGENNMVIAQGQEVTLPAGDYNKLYVLATSLNKDKEVTFTVGDSAQKVLVADYDENIGIWDIHDETLDVEGYVKNVDVGFMSTHRHVRGEDSIADSTYLFMLELDIPAGATTVTLPNDKDILIASATVVNDKTPGQFVTELYDQKEKTPSVDFGSNFFFGFEDDEAAPLENTNSSGGSVSNINWTTGKTSEDAHTGDNSFKFTFERTTSSGRYYAYAAVQTTNIPIYDDTYVEYWVKAADADAIAVGLDLVTSAGVIRDYPSQEGRTIVDTDGNLMHPEHHYTAVKETQKVGEWTKYRCNLGEFISGSTVTEINFAFDMGLSYVPTAGTHVAYLDDVYIGTGEEVKLDMTALSIAYMNANKIKSKLNDYVAASVQMYNKTMEEVRAIIVSEDKTQDDVDRATEMLINMMDAMELKPTFTNFSSFEETDPVANKNQDAKNGGTKSATFVSGPTDEAAHTGKYSFKLSVTKESNDNGYYAYASIYTAPIKISSDTYLEFWSLATDDISKYINIDAYIDNQNPPPLRDFDGGNVVDTTGTAVHPSRHGYGANVKVGEWVKYRVNLGQWLNGRTISELVFAFDYSNMTGTHTAYIDDIYIGNASGVNLVPMEAMIKLAESVNKNAYTAETVAALDTALAAAKAEVANNAKTQDSIDAAKAALSDAYVALEAKPEAPEVSLTTDAKYYAPNETITFTAKAPAGTVKVGLANENGKYITTSSRAYDAENDEWTITASVATCGDRTITLVAFNEDGSVEVTEATANITIAKVLPAGEDAVAVSNVNAPESVKKNEVFTVQVTTTTSATKIGVFTETGKALGKVSENYVDKDGERVWTVALKIGSKGSRALDVKAADIEGNWSEGSALNIIVK